MKKNRLKYIMICLVVSLLFLITSPVKLVQDKENLEKEELVNVTEFMEEAFAPSPITTLYAEEAPYELLAEFLANYYGISEEQRADTIYYYQYFDFDEDGTDEIFVVLVSDEMRESSGNPALLLKEDKNPGNENFFTAIESFERIHTPIVISDTLTNGWHDIILNQYGRGVESGYCYCCYEEGTGYQNEGNELYDEMPENLTGVAILSNNIIDDMDKEKCLTLAP